MLSYLHLKLLLLHGKKLLKSLKKDNLGIINFDVEDFIIVNTEETRLKSKFMFLNQSKFIELVNDNIIIEELYNKEYFFISRIIGIKFNTFHHPR